MLKTAQGDVVAYDLDRQSIAPFRIANLWRERNPRARLLPVVTLAFHPRDIGALLIGYSEGAVIYSFQQNKPVKHFRYEVPPRAPGGDSDPAAPNLSRFPRLTQALWHPTGTFILTGHEDSSIVIWDPKDGRKILARTLQAVNVDKPGAGPESLGSTSGTYALKEPIFRVAWCSKENPDETGILIAGGASTTTPTRGLSFLELGHTPIYNTSSWQVLSEHFEKPKKQYILPTPPNAEVVDFCLIPRNSPHYAGSYDPIAVLALLASGEMVTLSFPSGHPITPTNQLHPSLTFIHPFVSRMDMSYIERTQWLGMVENRSRGPMILKGGVRAKYPLRRFSHRNIIQTSHADGTIRIWDAGHGDEIENEAMLQVDVARAVCRGNGVNISMMSMSGATGELAVGLETGEMVVFRWGQNENFGSEIPLGEARGFGLRSIKDRAEVSMKEGLLPLTLLDQKHSPVTSVNISDVGFVGGGFEDGSLVVVDLRGPAVIYDSNIKDFAHQQKPSSFRRSQSSYSTNKPEWATVIEFGVMSLEGEGEQMPDTPQSPCS
jgi:syntaxin-binding protein 5